LRRTCLRRSFRATDPESAKIRGGPLDRTSQIWILIHTCDRTTSVCACPSGGRIAARRRRRTCLARCRRNVAITPVSKMLHLKVRDALFSRGFLMVA
jgi:hypothetical protein